MPTLKHLHLYRRISFKNRRQYMCQHPDCTHNAHKETLRGKRALCNECNEPFIMDGYALTVAFPKCQKCRKTDKTESRRQPKVKKEKIDIGNISILE